MYSYDITSVSNPAGGTGMPIRLIANLYGATGGGRSLIASNSGFPVPIINAYSDTVYTFNLNATQDFVFTDPASSFFQVDFEVINGITAGGTYLYNVDQRIEFWTNGQATSQVISCLPPPQGAQGPIGATGVTGVTGPTGPTGVVGPIANSDNTITALDSFNANTYRSVITDITATGVWNTLNAVPAISFTPQGTRPYQDYVVTISGLSITPNDSGGMTGNVGGRVGAGVLSIGNNPVPGRTAIGLTLYIPAVTGGGLTQDWPALFMYGATVTPIAQIWSINPATGVTNFTYPISAPNVALTAPPIFISPMNFPNSGTNTAIFSTVSYPALTSGHAYMMIWSDGLGVHSQGTFALVANTPPTNPPVFSGINFSSTFSESGVTAVAVTGNAGVEFLVQITGKTVASVGFAVIYQIT